MGIPSYFSYIIKNYKNIIRKLPDCEKFQYLLMDCNAIIYDSFYELEEVYNTTPFDISTIENKIIQKVIEKIECVIQTISPSKGVYIAFDGVAPFAKMDQQRTRRYKAQFMSSLNKTKKIWNTSAITPGTQFMDQLSMQVNRYFCNTHEDILMMISCSDKPGEGEHKLFTYIREHDCSKDNIAIHGLDSDLIMLSIYHKQFTKNICVYREERKDLKILDIGELNNVIKREMGGDEREYVLMCLLLGNDFLPHFPSLNIRSHGFSILFEGYRKKMCNRPFIKDNKIDWESMLLYITEIEKDERKHIIDECKSREKYENRKWSGEEEVLNVALQYRMSERYVNPEEEGWCSRYRKCMLGGSRIEVCKNYVEGLEWVLKYYTIGCVDWRWKYKYDYAPLLKDLKGMIPKNGYERFKGEEYGALDAKAQLVYVLPYESVYLLGETGEEIKRDYKELYPEKYEFKWGFCRYFWEAHPVLPEIKIETLLALSQDK
jgi:5'-3' exonuclease